MDLERAEEIASALVAELEPYCRRLVVAGSIRRRRPLVQDIDLVLIPRSQGALAVKLQGMGCRFGGKKLMRFLYRGVQVDVYVAYEDTWAMLLLVRTGSAAHNTWLAMRAKRMGKHFAADGQGILKDGERVAWRSEAEIFEALGLAYVPPEKRERQQAW